MLIYFTFKIPNRRLHVLSETYQKALVLPREIDVQIDKIQVSSLPADHPFPEETVLSLSLVKSGRDSKLFKKGCALKRSKSNADKGIFYFIHISSKNDILF